MTTDTDIVFPRRRKRSPWPKRVALVLFLAAAGGAIAWYRAPLYEAARKFAGASDQTGPVDVQTYTLKRGPMHIAIVEEGKLRAVKNYPVVMGVTGKITWLAEAGKKVKKGDLLVTLDKKQLEDQRLLRMTDIDTQKAALAVAQQSVPISRSKGEAAVSAAKTKAEEAGLALKQYQTIDAPKRVSELETQLSEARTKLADAQRKKTDAQAQLDEKLLDEGDEKKSLEAQIELQVQTIGSLQKVMNTQEDQRKLFRAYNYPQELKSKQQAVKNAELEVIKAQVESTNEVSQKEAEVKRAQAMLDRDNNDLKHIDEQITMCQAFSPQDGLVFYGSPEMMRYYGDVSDRVRVGQEWYSDEPIMTIPDLSAFQVDMPIAEVYRGRVTPGMKATMTIQAIPGLELDGALLTLASVARNKISYDSSSPQVFDTVLSVARVEPRMVAGMTVRVEITTADLTDVLTAPIEAVFNEGGKPAVFLWVEDAGKGEKGGGHAEKRPVLPGNVNDHFVEIARGLTEGNKILLSRPATFVTPLDYGKLVEAVAPAVIPTTAASSQPVVVAARPVIATSQPVAAATESAATKPASETAPATQPVGVPAALLVR